MVGLHEAAIELPEQHLDLLTFPPACSMESSLAGVPGKQVEDLGRRRANQRGTSATKIDTTARQLGGIAPRDRRSLQ